MKPDLRPILFAGGCLAASLAAAATPDFRARSYDFPVYTNAPIGRQISGQHAPASTPALAPAEAQKKFTLPEGFEIRIFAAEPMVVNPVAMTWDARGRLWVLELYEYPKGAVTGTKGRDRIKILEDTDGDGVADKVHVWADGLSLATGLLLGDGGAYVGQAPDLLFLSDTNGDDRADKREVFKTGFGSEDRHELLNGFTWGPEGDLYMTHGVFTYSTVKNPNDPDDDGVLMNAAVARLNTRTKKFEVFADGTSNPWGVDFDARGNAFVSACVIDHFFHLVPGGLYARQAGQPNFPYAYELLPSIVDHRHKMAAYCGVQIYQGNQFPAEWSGRALMGNIHDNSVHADKLTPKGSSFVASEWKDLVRANDGWFRPTMQRVGPDGAVWISDWYDRYPCYQNAVADPEGVDRELGRIWRVVYTGKETGKPVPSRPSVDMDLAKLSTDQLVQQLANDNVWQRRMAQRLLTERGPGAFGSRSLHPETSLHKMFEEGPNPDARLAALWTLHGMQLLNDGDLDKAAEDKAPGLRTWAARLTGERGLPLGDAMQRLSTLAKDPDPGVRLGVTVAARQFVSGALTIDTPPKVPIHEVVTGPILSALFVGHQDRTKEENDPVLDFLYWMALEPIIAFDPVHGIGAYKRDGAVKEQPFSAKLLTKIMHRVCDLRDEDTLSRSVIEFGGIPESAASTLIAGLQGLLDGQRGKILVPNTGAIAVVSRLAQSSNPELAKAAQEVGSLWGDASAVRASLARITDASASEADRIAAIRTARRLKTDETRAALLGVFSGNASETLKVEAVRGMADVGEDDTAQQLLAKWATLSPTVRAAVAELCTTRGNWKWPFYAAIERGEVKRGDIPPTVIRSLATSKADNERQKAIQLFGRVNQSSEEKLKLIAAKRKVVVAGPIDLAAGHEVAQRNCFICHKLYGEGGDVGPDLTGVGRSSLDALLHNVINPNEIIGAGYEQVEVETKDDQVFSGRMTENTATHVKLVMAGPSEAVIDKSKVKNLTVTQLSAMPEGLEQMPEADFRNLIWFILSPPQEGPLTPEKRAMLGGGE
jgi:putative membrane-bound dehydrogenase-like protein